MVIRAGITAILFDLDGTIFHLAVDWSGIRSEISKHLGREFESYEAMLKELARPELSDVAKMLEEAELKGVLDGTETSLAGKSLQKLAKKYKLAVVTRNSRSSAAQALKKIGVNVDVIIGREDVENLKPHPEALEIALQQLNVGVHEAVMVGDTTHDILAAHKIGMKCIIIKNENLVFSPPGANEYINNLSELAANLVLLDLKDN